MVPHNETGACSATEQGGGEHQLAAALCLGRNVLSKHSVISYVTTRSNLMSDQHNRQNQQGGQQGGGGQKPGQQQQQQPNQKPGQAGKKQAELDKKWRDVAEPGQEPGTGQPGT